MRNIDYTYSKTDRTLTLSNGSRILFRTVNTRNSAWQTVSAGWIHAENLADFSLEQFDQLLKQLHGPNMQQWRFFGTTRPVVGHWLNTQFGPGSEKQEGFRRVIGKTAENPGLADAYLRLLERRTPPEHRRAYLEGRSELDPDEIPIHPVIIEDNEEVPYLPERVPGLIRAWAEREAIKLQKKLNVPYLPLPYWWFIQACPSITGRLRLTRQQTLKTASTSPQHLKLVE